MSAPAFAPAGEHPYPVPSFTPAAGRQPGASIAHPVPHAMPEADLHLLARVRDGLNRIARGDEGIYARLATEFWGTGPLAVVPGPLPCQPTLADQRARYALAEIVYAAARHAEPPYGLYCPDCRAAASGWCDACIAAEEKSGALDQLHGLILAADTFAAAVMLVARAQTWPAAAAVTGTGERAR
jgi:hypothetical protein